MVKKTQDESPVVEIQQIEMGYAKMHIVGDTPLIMNRFSKKAREELLLPRIKMNSAEKAESLKHDPVAEFRGSVYLNRDPKQPTAIHFPADAFGEAMASAAIDIPGAKKAQIERLTRIASVQVNVYGCPKLHMSMVRQSDIGRTPDVRTRAIFQHWACVVDVKFVSSLIKQKQVINLLAAAGVLIGIGDARPQKGKSHGQFRIANAEDKEFLRILDEGGREAQLAALEAAVPYDAETEELLAWFRDEVRRREKRVPSDINASAAVTVQQLVS